LRFFNIFLHLGLPICNMTSLSSVNFWQNLLPLIHGRMIKEKNGKKWPKLEQAFNFQRVHSRNSICRKCLKIIWEKCQQFEFVFTIINRQSLKVSTFSPYSCHLLNNATTHFMTLTGQGQAPSSFSSSRQNNEHNCSSLLKIYSNVTPIFLSKWNLKADRIFLILWTFWSDQIRDSISSIEEGVMIA